MSGFPNFFFKLRHEISWHFSAPTQDMLLSIFHYYLGSDVIYNKKQHSIMKLE